MADIEKVIKELEERIKVAEECMGNPMFTPDAIRTIVALLKEQEAVEPYSHLTNDSDLYFTCGKCGHVIWSESYKHCPMCGLKIAWNGEGR